MRITLTLAILLALSSAVSAAVVSLPIQTFTNPKHLNAQSLTRRYFQKRASVTSPLTNIEQDLIYTIPFSIGTPPQSFNVIVDTGSPVTWVASNTCATAGCAKTKKFTCTASSTCKPMNTPFNASYVGGLGIEGEYIAEQYNIGGLSFRGVAGLVHVDTADLPTSVDGIMGLWYYNKETVIPILNVLKSNMALDQNIIGIYLTTSDANVTAPGGEITFGGVNTERFSGSISYVNCVAGRPWTLPLNSMTVNGKTINAAKGQLATIDTGTTAMLVPKVAADAINSAIPGAVQAPNAYDLWFLPCEGSYPITMVFGDYTANVPYKSIAMQSTAQRTSDGLYCQSAVMFPVGEMTSIEEWLVGDVFLKNVYSVFDFENNAENGGRIGFAALGSGGQISAGASLLSSISLTFMIQSAVVAMASLTMVMVTL